MSALSTDEFDQLPEDPFVLLSRWLPANDDPERPVMTLATNGTAGFPDARTVTLSEFDSEGIYFHTEALSRKVQQLSTNPTATVVILLLEQQHQIVAQGVTEVAPRFEQERAYLRRKPYLQQLAWQNTPEFAMLPQSDRIEAWQEFLSEHPDGFTPPQNWTGFLLRPLRLTFWFGSDETASRRAEYTRDDLSGPWTVGILAG